MSSVEVSARIASDLAAEFGPAARARLGDADGQSFLDRLEQIVPDAVRTLDQLYGARTDSREMLRSLVGDVLDRAAVREASLRALDRDREADPGWFQRPAMIGYVCYADRFAGTLAGVQEHLDHLDGLGVTYLHLMPLLRPRPGQSDGGYAVQDYDAVDERLGTMADLTALADDLHKRDSVLCIDMVINHTAREHDWARRAAAGDPHYRAFYRVYPDRTAPDEWERTLPDIFPELAPGSFTWDDELDGWVWTTFYDFQWDLDWANPDVFRAMLDTMLRVANRGVDVLRVDAAPFLWKTPGTDCMDRPEAHLVLQALRALTRLAAPGVLLKAEAMVGPDLLGGYLGAHEVYRPECELAYDNQLMVMLWSAVATGDARLARQSLGRRAAPPAATSWVTYGRCHDDIGWAVADLDAAAVGLDGPQHRRWLSDFYAGSVPGSFARGRVFQDSPLGESPTSGTFASLCGVEAALAVGDADALELALRRLESMYSVVFSFGGIPLLYMGDELALRNDPHAADDPAHAADNRWIHRPAMDWNAVARPDAVAQRSLAALRSLAAARARTPVLHGAEPVRVLEADDQVLAYVRGTTPRQRMVALVNVGPTPAFVSDAVLADAGITAPVHLHSTHGRLDISDGGIHLPACGFAWIGNAPV